MIFKIKLINSYGIKRFSKLPCGVGRMPRFMPNYKHGSLKTSTIRSNFIDYFLKQNHKYIEPCSLNSKNSGSYFVNSGVSQFKEHILGYKSIFSDVDKAVNSQRCVRLGGKKCDLNNIGYDSTHLSYFEMLGNWSFGNYDKKEACKLMWKFLTEELELPSSHLYVTYFGGSDKLGLVADHETRDIWFSLGVKDSKVLEFGEDHNFWEMGPRSMNHLCGPSTEIHWDYLATMSDSNDPRCARCFVNSSSPEVAELWNCVFMEYKWSAGGTTLSKLPALIIDTGMGLERLSSVIQGVCSVFDTDGFKDIMNHLSELSKNTPYQGTFSLDSEFPVSQRLRSSTEETRNLDNSLRRDVAYRIIADHLRALCLCMNDGIRPGRAHLELKVRHLLQRTLRQSRFGLGMTGGLSPLVDTVCQSLNEWHAIDPSVATKLKIIIDKEEKTFFPKLDSYEKSFDNFLLHGDSKYRELSKDEIESLIDGKFGESISMDMIGAMSRDAGLIINDVLSDDDLPDSVDSQSNVSMHLPDKHVLLNRKIPVTDNSPTYNYTFNKDLNIYEVKDLETTVTALLLVTPLNNESFIDGISADDQVSEFGLLTEQTNMFPTKGGQESDKGLLLVGPNNEVVASINNVTVLDCGYIIHWCTFSHPAHFLRVTDKVKLRVDNDHRTGTTLHHSGHHIVFASLNKLLGKVNQASSSVTHNHAKLQFFPDITLGVENILSNANFAEQLEKTCCNIIRSAVPILKKDKVKFSEISKDPSVRFLKSEFLPEEVRLVSIGDASEVCCGTHAENTQHLQDIIITTLKHTNQAISEVGFVVGKDALQIRKNDQELSDMCAEIDQISNDRWKPIDHIINSLNNALGRNVMSKTTRDMVIQSVDTAKKYMIEAPSISEVLDKIYSSNLNAPNDTCVIYVKSLSIKKAVKRLHELRVNTPAVMYDNKNMLVYYPERNICGNIHEFIEDFLQNTNHKISDFTIELPKVKQIDNQILSQFVSISFPGAFDDSEKLVTNIKKVIGHL